MKKIFLSCLAILGSISMIQAKVELPPVFADNMILQQQTDAAIWGKSEPGAKITITTTWSKSKTTVNADADGKWFARVATPAAGGPYEITINDGDKVTLKNVLIGEVWICSGQSNMEMPMKGFPSQPTAGAADLILDAKPSTPIRSCNLKRTCSIKEEFSCPAKWYVNDPEGVAEASATAYFFAHRLYRTLDIPIGIINVSWGGTPIRSWMSREVLESEFSSEINLSHFANGALPEKRPQSCGGALYNGMLHSVIPFTAKGFIWYQGCADRLKYEQYTRLQPAFAKMLRKEWGNDAMPFYFTQIAPYKYNDPEERDGAFMMWAQAQTLELIPNSGMATTHDAGELDCIHPANKKAVGDRLAFLALANDYGIKGIEAKAPMPGKIEFKDGAAFVDFDCGKLGIGPLSGRYDGFELAGEDKVFYPAVGVLQKDRRSVKVACPEVHVPVAVRYGMKNWSVATIFNNFGIPASPFRSDNW